MSEKRIYSVGGYPTVLEKGILGYYPPTKIDYKTAFPASSLETEFIDALFVPTSIGADGYIYGRGLDDQIIKRSQDGMETSEDGFDFSGEDAPYIVTNTEEGYLVLTRNINPERTKIFFSESFNEGFELVAEMTTGYVEEFSFDYYKGGKGREVILAGEYGSGPEERKLYASFDGGRSFEVILTIDLKDPNTQAHFHHSVYDPYQGRIWASNGDSENRLLQYSDDLGQTWKKVMLNEADIAGSHPQPTLLMPTPHKLVFGPDASGTNPYIGSIIRDRNFVNYDERFRMSWEVSLFADEISYNVYGRAPYASNKKGEYYCISPAPGHNKSFIAASGDAGQTWHLVHTVDFRNAGAMMPRILVGLDDKNYMYAYCNDGQGDKIMKAKAINWI